VQMKWMNTNKGYGVISRLLHIIVAILLIVQLSVGFWMIGLLGDSKALIYSYHKSFGLFILALAWCRLVWRVINPVPKLNTSNFSGLLARSIHCVFYSLLLVIPISGWVMSTKVSSPPYVPYLGYLAFPLIKGKSVCILGHPYDWAIIFSNIHEYTVYFLLICIVLHTIIAYRHAKMKNEIYKRMFSDQT